MIERLTDRASPWSPVLIVLVCALAPMVLAGAALVGLYALSLVLGVH